MWGGTDEKESIRTIHGAFDHGINLIDTAPIYGYGRSEAIVGEAVRLHGRRDSVILARKVGIDWTNGKIERNSTHQRILRELEDSLRRLQTAYIDIYQEHWPDPLVPIEETAATLRELHEQGKIRAIGVSNYSPEEMRRFQAIAPLPQGASLKNLGLLRGPRDGNRQLVCDVEWPVRLAQEFAGEQDNIGFPFLNDGVGLSSGGYQPCRAGEMAGLTANLFGERDLIAATDWNLCSGRKPA